MSWVSPPLFRLLTLLLLPAAVLPVSAQIAPQADANLSSDRRFTVRGGEPRQNAKIAEWMSDIHQRVEKKLGAAMPMHRRGQVLEISFIFRDPTSEPRVRPDREWLGPYLVQTLTITNPDQLGQEELLERLVGQMVERYVVARQEPKERIRHAYGAPAWFNVGCAQNLYANTRSRNREALARMTQQGRLPSVDAILGWDRLGIGLR